MVRWVQSQFVPQQVQRVHRSSGEASDGGGGGYDYVASAAAVTPADVQKMRELRTDMLIAFAGFMFGASVGAYTVLRCGFQADEEEGGG